MFYTELLWIGTGYAALHFSLLPPFQHIAERFGHKWLRWLFAILLAALLFAFAKPFHNAFAAFFLYMCMGYAITDVAHLFLRKRESAFARVWKRFYAWSVIPFLLGMLLAVGGFINARVIRTTAYEVALANAPEKGLRIALLSDMHAGTSIKQKDYSRVIAQINAMQPDIVLLGGDIFDENSSAADIEYVLQEFTTLRATYGIYFIPGNHEYIAHRAGVLDIEQLLERMRQAGINTLVEEARTIEGQFTLVGRNDPGGTSMYGRKPLAELLYGIDTALPILVMDHRPVGQAEAEYCGVSLQISGHTHNGQLFPIGLASRLRHLYDMEYGYRQSGSYHAIVGSGAGTWALPVRVGSKSEIVLISIHK